MRIRFLIMLMFLSAAFAAAGQSRFYWDVDFTTVFDNREGDRDHTAPETIFFTRLSPEVGFDFGSAGRVGGGVVWVQPIACQWNGKRVSPTLYYRLDGGRWSGSVGIFPRTQLIEELPSFMWCDSLSYFRSNIRGALLQWRSQRSFAEIYLDWRQMQTASKRESFAIAVHGRWQHPSAPLMGGAYVTMNHLALTKNAPEDMHIVDNFMAAPYVGVDLSHRTGLDSLRVRAGAAVTIERNRAFGDWRAPAGGWLELVASWKMLQLKNMLYAGGHLLPSYGLFGAELYQGEPYYAADFYNRTEVSCAIVRRRHVDLRAELDFNVTPGSFQFYQRITLRVTFGSSYPLRLRTD